MGYLHIENLYKNQDILLFKEAYALEKIHGTSAHISWNENRLTFFSGGCKHDRFKALFDETELTKRFSQSFKDTEVIIFGEAYGGKIQGMSKVYGKELRFIAFEVKIGKEWLAVPQAEKVTTDLGLEFVFYERIPATLEAFDKARERPSEQAKRNGCGDAHKSEGIVIRPPIEVRKNNGDRIIVKHKNEEFRETAHPRPTSAKKITILNKADEVAKEFVTPMRLEHALDKLGLTDTVSPKDIPKVIPYMIDDIFREGKGEFVGDVEAIRKAIGKETARLLLRGKPRQKA